MEDFHLDQFFARPSFEALGKPLDASIDHATAERRLHPIPGVFVAAVMSARIALSFFGPIAEAGREP
jgi:hypothetical protein